MIILIQRTYTLITKDTIQRQKMIMTPSDGRLYDYLLGYLRRRRSLTRPLWIGYAGIWP